MHLVDGMALTRPIITNIVAAAMAATAAWHSNGWRLHAQIAQIKQQHATQLVIAQDQAREAESGMQTRLTEARNEATKRETQLRADLAASRNALGILQHTANTLRRDVSGYPQRAAAHAAATAAELLTDCAATYASLAEKADRHAADALTLRDAWPQTPKNHDH